jgi:cytochrome b involved in lipid metabolism
MDWVQERLFHDLKEKKKSRWNELSMTERTFTMEQVRKHKKSNDCWIVINDHVLDVTHFLNKHPSGADIILEHAGQDATAIFEKFIHSDMAYEMMLGYKVGKVVTGTLP